MAQLKKKASRQIVLDANEMLVRMSHRGGCGCEPNTGKYLLACLRQREEFDTSPLPPSFLPSSAFTNAIF